jgi:hypothetical protein
MQVIVRLLKLSTQCLEHAAYHALCGCAYLSEDV